MPEPEPGMPPVVGHEPNFQRVITMNPVTRLVPVLCLSTLLCLGSTGVTLAESPAGPDSESDEVAESHPIMNQPLDGSSPEALAANLEKVRETASEHDFTRLRNALGKMRIYDLSIKNDSAKLAAAVDGKTPEEVIEASADLWR